MATAGACGTAVLSGALYYWTGMKGLSWHARPPQGGFGLGGIVIHNGCCSVSKYYL